MAEAPSIFAPVITDNIHMEKDLINIIANYFVEEISSTIQSDVAISWSYNSAMNYFVLKFELVNTQFVVVAKARNSKYGMSIEPDENRIKIECQNYLKSFEQVVNILSHFEKELKYFDWIFPSVARCQYIRDNYSLLNRDRSSNVASKRYNLNLLSNKYLGNNRLEDEYGVKEIALTHLLAKEFFINMKK